MTTTDGGPTTSTGPDLRTTAGKLADARARREATLSPGSARAVERQHAKGKRTARERLEALLDEDSFVEVGAHSPRAVGRPLAGLPRASADGRRRRRPRNGGRTPPSSSTPRTSPSPAARSARCTPRRSSR
ncbi:MAG: hypothetical protein PGN11_18615 [Quadrisphaera sp.]